MCVKLLRREVSDDISSTALASCRYTGSLPLCLRQHGLPPLLTLYTRRIPHNYSHYYYYTRPPHGSTAPLCPPRNAFCLVLAAIPRELCKTAIARRTCLVMILRRTARSRFLSGTRANWLNHKLPISDSPNVLNSSTCTAVGSHQR